MGAAAFNRARAKQPEDDEIERVLLAPISAQRVEQRQATPSPAVIEQEVEEEEGEDDRSVVRAGDEVVYRGEADPREAAMDKDRRMLNLRGRIASAGIDVLVKIGEDYGLKLNRKMLPAAARAQILAAAEKAE